MSKLSPKLRLRLFSLFSIELHFEINLKNTLLYENVGLCTFLS